MALTNKQLAFVNYYVGEANLNGTRAATLAGYSNPRQAASRLLSNADIRAEIDARLEVLTIRKSEILARLTDHALASIEDFIDDLGYVDLAKMREAGKLHLIKKVKRIDGEKTSSIEVEIHDAQTALLQLGRYYALFTDKTESRNEVRIVKADDLTDDELASIATSSGAGTPQAP